MRESTLNSLHFWVYEASGLIGGSREGSGGSQEGFRRVESVTRQAGRQEGSGTRSGRRAGGWIKAAIVLTGRSGLDLLEAGLEEKRRAARSGRRAPGRIKAAVQVTGRSGPSLVGWGIGAESVFRDGN